MLAKDNRFEKVTFTVFEFATAKESWEDSDHRL
jgi:hypothetical protein